MNFNIGQQVTVGKVGKDPGGTGEVTRIKSDVTRDGANVQLRVDIHGNPKQDAAREKKGKKHRGFWYDAAVAN